MENGGWNEKEINRYACSSACPGHDWNFGDSLGCSGGGSSVIMVANGSVWNVTETSYLSVLNTDETSVVNGTVTVLDSGIIMVEPKE